MAKPDFSTVMLTSSIERAVQLKNYLCPIRQSVYWICPQERPLMFML